MKPRNAEATRLQEDYLNRLRAILGDHPHATGIVESVTEHIEEAAGEISSPEISLVQMAEILERLGTPESFVPPEQRNPVPEEVGAAPVRSGLMDDAANLLHRVWWGYLVGVVGLYVPFIGLHICQIISCVMLALAFGSWGYDRPAGFRSLSILNWVCGVVVLLLCPLAVLTLVVPPLGILGLPVAIAYFVLNLVIYWKTMTGTADLVREDGAEELSRHLLRTRNTYIWIEVAFFILTFVIALVLGVILALALGARDAQQAAAITDLALPVCVLPIGWLLGWFFVLRPLGMAREYLRERSGQVLDGGGGGGGEG